MIRKYLAIVTVVLIIIVFILRNFHNFSSFSSQKPSAGITPSPVPTLAARTPLKWGIYAGDNVNDFIDLRHEIAAKPDFLPVFVHWGNESEFPSNLAEYAYLQDQTLVIYWEAMNYLSPKPETDSRYSYQKILSGTFDTYLKNFAADTKNYGRPVIIVPFEEMNGDWYPWSVTQNGNTPNEHIQAYRHIRRFFNNVPNVKFAWVINSDSVPDTSKNDPMSYYPGDAYVDYVGVDGFNFDDPWQNFSEVFTKPLSSLASIKKPLIIFSMASAPGPQKVAWIKDAASVISKNNQIVGWIWFNENKEKDWRISSDPDSRNAFNTFLLSAHP